MMAARTTSHFDGWFIQKLQSCNLNREIIINDGTCWTKPCQSIGIGHPQGCWNMLKQVETTSQNHAGLWTNLRKSVEVVVISNAVADFADLSSCVLAGSQFWRFTIRNKTCNRKLGSRVLRNSKRHGLVYLALHCNNIKTRLRAALCQSILVATCQASHSSLPGNSDTYRPGTQWSSDLMARCTVKEHSIMSSCPSKERFTNIQSWFKIIDPKFNLEFSIVSKSCQYFRSRTETWTPRDRWVPLQSMQTKTPRFTAALEETRWLSHRGELHELSWVGTPLAVHSASLIFILLICGFTMVYHGLPIKIFGA